VLLALSTWLIVPIAGPLTLTLFIVTRGMAHGGMIVDVPILTRHYFGPERLGLTIGIMSVAVNLGFASGPPLLGWLADVNDSKVVLAPERERLAEIIKAECVSYAIAWSTVAEIDALNIRQANFLAMRRAIASLGVKADHVLIDGPWPIACPLPQKSIVDGDALVSSIAAASIVAKVARDAFMCHVSRFFPEWRFHEHKGYSTPDHLERLAKYGASSQHRRSWLAVRRRAGLPIEGEEADVPAAEGELAQESVTIPVMYLRDQPSPTPNGRAPSSRRAASVTTT
jgi:ribonuclease HII